jgi:hypothetical protein
MDVNTREMSELESLRARVRTLERRVKGDGPPVDDCCDMASSRQICNRMSVVDALRFSADELEKHACQLRELADALPAKLPQNADDVLFSMIAATRVRL